MIHANDAFAPVAFLQLKSLSLQEKEDITSTLDKSSQKELIEKSGVVIKVRSIWFLFTFTKYFLNIDGSVLK